jgi:hypothetical protein
MFDSMQRIAILAVAAVLVLLVVVQFALPPLAERRAEKRLTEGGGHAKVELSALPSARLLFGEGDSLRVRASDLAAPLPDPGSKKTLSDLDGFGKVDIQVTNMHMGPFRVDRLTLVRDRSDGPYRTTIAATVTGAELSSFAGRTLAGGLGGFLGGIAGGVMPGAQAEIPIALDAVLRSQDGRAQAVAVNGSVAGVPAGPLVELFAAALAGRF